MALDPRFNAQLQQLIRASGGRIWVNSGYRSPEEQGRLWNAAIQKYGSEAAARKYVAPPGRSNHNRGLAADLGGDLALAARLGPQFGLRFPMSWEPWHIEPSGLRDNPDAYTTGDTADQPNPTSAPRTVEDTVGDVINMLMGNSPEPTLPLAEQGETVAPEESVESEFNYGGEQTFSPEQIARVAYAAGFKDLNTLTSIVAIAMRESGGQVNVWGDKKLQTSTWGPSVGLFQIRTLKGQTGTGGPRDIQALMNNPLAQAKAAWEISGGGRNWTPWTVARGNWRSGANWAMADKAAKAVLSGVSV